LRLQLSNENANAIVQLNILYKDFY